MHIIRHHPHNPSLGVLNSFARAYSSYVATNPRVQKPAVPKIKTSKIAVPAEHGGWGFLFEPIVAGLAVAFSLAGICIAVMTIGAFLVRQPLKMLVIDRMGMKVNERALTASYFVLGFGAIFALGLVATVMTAGWMPLLPFAIVLPLAAIQMYFDFTRKSRNVLPELGGAVTISASAAAIALAGGWSWPIALGLWAIFVARLIPSILYVRERLLLEKGKPFTRTVPMIAHAAALVGVAVLALFGLSPILVVAAMLILLGRAIEGLSANRRKMKAMKIGIFEVVFGTLTVLAVIIGHYTGI